MKAITEENREIIEQWYKDARLQTVETLPKFIGHVLNDYVHNYGTICRAIGTCALAAAWAADNSEQGGITGFQAGYVAWTFLQQWAYPRNKCGLRIVDYDNMLYPQYKREFDKTTPKRVMDALVVEAKEYLSNITDEQPVSPDVKEHWEKIAQGVPPFGFSVVGN